MDFLDSFFKRKHAPKKDVTKPPPEKGAALFFFLLTTHFSKMLTLNLLFLLFCLPIVTIPAALSGMNRVCILLVREGVSFVWTDFIAEFKSNFLKSISLFLVNAVFFSVAYFCVFMGQWNETKTVSFILFAFAVLFFIVGLLMSCYSFAMLALCRLRNRDILRNALSLIFLEPKTDILLVIFVGVIMLGFLYLFPYSAPIIFLGIFSLLSLISSVICYEPLTKRIIIITEVDKHIN